MNKLNDMNFKFLFLTVLSAMIFIGCSTENAEDFENTMESFKTTQKSSNAKVVTRPFKSKADGRWFIVESTECDGLLQYSIEGTGNATHMGKVDIEGRICTFPPDGIYFLTVTFTAANGDKLTWQSEEVFINDQGLYAGGVFNCLDGTGRFSDAVGTITVNEVLEPTDFDPSSGLPLAGLFSNDSEGTITF
jgi:hypothetical protein